MEIWFKIAPSPPHAHHALHTSNRNPNPKLKLKLSPTTPKLLW